MRLVRSVAAVPLFALIVGCGGTSHQSGVGDPKPDIAHVKTFRGPGFSTSVPAGWHERQVRSHGVSVYFSGSGRAPNNLGLAHGGIGVSIGELPPASVRGKSSALAAMKGTVGIPTAAIASTVVRRPRVTTLAGADAATLQVAYKYQDQPNVQSDLLATHRHKFVLVEVDADPSFQPLAQKVMRRIETDWRWLRPGAPTNHGNT